MDFTTITGSPSDDNIKKICEVLINLLQSIDVRGSADSLSGLLDNDDYLGKWGHSFDRLAIVLIVYEPNIQTDATDAIHSKAKLLWTASLTRQRLIKTAERLGHLFF